MEDKIQLLEQQLKELQKRDKEWQEKCEALQEENAKLAAESSAKSHEKIKHSKDFWTNIDNDCAKKTGPYCTHAIKTMIKTGKMTVHDTDFYGRTLLHLAARNGAYDLVQFLLNNV